MLTTPSNLFIPPNFKFLEIYNPAPIVKLIYYICYCLLFCNILSMVTPSGIVSCV